DRRAALPPRVSLALDVERAGGAAAAAFVFEPGAFGADTIARFRARFLALVAAAAARPGQPVSGLDLLPAEEAQTLAAWNATDADYASDACVHELVAAQARRTPAAVAVVDERSQLTYAELDARAERLAARLRGAGVAVETRVGLALARSAATVVALLGVQKSGGAYVPIDLGLPRERVRAMLADAGVTHLVADAGALELLPDAGATIVLLDADGHVDGADGEGGDAPADARPPAPSSPASSLAPRATPDNLAYVMFTSGSTGRPKGVQISHRALVNFLESMRRRPGIGADDVLLAVTPLSFDISGLELYLPLVAGARVVVASREATPDGGRLARLIAEQGVTMMQATPTTYWLLLASGWQGSASCKLLVGGEAVPADLVEQLAPRCASLWNMYGPTETTIWSTCGQLRPGGAKVPIGTPIANTQAYVLGPALERLPIGVKGELYLGGHGLARGYAGRPDLTAERFVASPFAGPGPARLYRTGDLARFLPDGRLECLGRVDSQIKLRGFRIELGEIEHVLSSNPALKGAVVLLREDVPGDKRLVAYVVSKSRTATVSAADLAERAKAALPAYMVPSSFVVLDAFPLNPSGKIDRRALAALDLGEQRAAAPTAPYESPSGDLEGAISAVWGEVLGAPKVGRHDNFFDLGGNSLLALQVHGKLVARLGRDFPILSLFTHPTVVALANHFAGAEASAPAKARAPAGRDALLEQGAQRRAQRQSRRVGGDS
ncbi:MAG TPA: amino acid adenylation domain-containing protein, partial [Polyangiaceae bacterium]|nr:amino acid adenylation domain-containing protein [Polyangiaceae bacterium]